MSLEQRKNMAVLQIIAIEVSNSKHGDFLKTVAKAWQLAHPPNKRILMSVWDALVDKYELRTEYAEAIDKHIGEYMLH